MTQTYSFEQVERMLRDEDQSVQFAALKLMGRLNERELEQLLAEALLLAIAANKKSDRSGLRARIPQAFAEYGERVYRKMTSYLLPDADPMMLMLILETIEQSFRTGSRGEPISATLSALVTTDDVTLLEGLLSHSEWEIRFKAGKLLQLAPFNSMVQKAPQVASWWLSDKSGDGKWFFAGQEMLEAFGVRANDALSLCVRDPHAVLASANVEPSGRIAEIVRDRAAAVMIKLGAKASACGPALLIAIGKAKDDRAPEASTSLEHLCRAFVTIQAPPGLGEDVRSLLLHAEPSYTMQSLWDYFRQQPGEGLEEIMVLLDHGKAEEALDLLVPAVVAQPDALRLHVGSIDNYFRSDIPEHSLRAATVLVGLGKTRLEEVCPTFGERMTELVNIAREKIAESSWAYFYIYLLRLNDALEADTPADVIEIRHSIHFRDKQKKAA